MWSKLNKEKALTVPKPDSKISKIYSKVRKNSFNLLVNVYDTEHFSSRALLADCTDVCGNDTMA